MTVTKETIIMKKFTNYYEEQETYDFIAKAIYLIFGGVVLNYILRGELFLDRIILIIFGYMGVFIIYPFAGLIYGFIIKVIMKNNFKIYEKDSYDKIQKYKTNAQKSVDNLKLTKPSLDKLDYYCYSINKKQCMLEDFHELKTISMRADKQYDFLKTEIENITKFMKETLIEYEFNNYDFVSNILKNKNWSISDMTNEIMGFHKFTKTDKDENLELLKNTINHEIFFDKLFNHCKSQGINMNHDTIQDKFNETENVIPFFDSIFKDIFIQFAGLKKGSDGEKKVDEHLDLYSDTLINMSNIRLELENTSIETDNVIITNKGIFLVEVKNYGKEGETIEISKDGKWKRYYSNNKNVQKEIKNIQEQHNRHIGIMQRFINNKLKEKGLITEYIEFEPIIVIANDDVEIINDSTYAIMRTSNIHDYIRKFRSEITLSKEVQNEIYEILNANKKEAKSYPIISYELAFKERFKFLLNNMNVINDYYWLYRCFTEGIVEDNKTITVKTIKAVDLGYKENFIFID